ncbi:orotidine 5'-phosphate decarboxylase [Pullulanibacillus camelliae]|uniref:Orotidine 5'-phosphate decarboxylase n=1 Tax=Pullulanibacillus camelliae TaxID=1707096 RepID=A0A8J2VW58_9BACL|nr:orotidine-5'-phosphate decarboxylase [Pullulanibacillus camelliae]GGE41578.1 orotidine 5'-phosphate decarboxylase [Pullulanibacillus camelliae]
MGHSVIVALDVSTTEELQSLLNPLKKAQPYVKIGMELYYQHGPELVRQLKADGFRIFLDLKLHDIPSTVYKAMRGLAKLHVDMVNVHAAGGKDMMCAAIQGLEEGMAPGASRPLCLAVTQLTSTDQQMLEKELHIKMPMEQVVNAYGLLAYRSGCDGVVCSPQEARAIKHVTSQQFVTVTPGIRLAGDAKNDQKRVATPQEARQLGSDFIVVGRSITQAEDPFAAYERVLNEWSEAYVNA